MSIPSASGPGKSRVSALIKMGLAATLWMPATHAGAAPVFLECTRVYHSNDQYNGEVTHNDFALDEQNASATVTVRESGYSSGAVPAVFSPTTVTVTDATHNGTYTIDRSTLQYKVTFRNGGYVYTGTCVIDKKKVDRKF